MKTCRICGSADTSKVIDLGHHPLADRFLTEEMLGHAEHSYPLTVHLCHQCGYAGNGFIVPSHVRYQQDEYSYTAGNSPVSVRHFDELAMAIVGICGLPAVQGDRDRLVVDLGGNDGTLLIALQRHLEPHYGQRLKLLNVEPSPNIGKVSRERGIDTRAAIWDGESAGELFPLAYASIITATNVLNHASDPRGFVRAVGESLIDGGWFVFEVPSLAELVRQCAFDTIYHEHVSYFGMRPLEKLLATAGLHIRKVEAIPYMGGSVRVFAVKERSLVFRWVCNVPGDDDGLYQAGRFHDVGKRAGALRASLRREIDEANRAGHRVIALGAPAKGNTLLNYCGLDHRDIRYIVDSSPHKAGKFAPGSHIEILSDDVLGSTREPIPTTALVLPWNIADYLIEKYKWLPLTTFLVPSGADRGPVRHV